MNILFFIIVIVLGVVGLAPYISMLNAQKIIYMLTVGPLYGGKISCFNYITLPEFQILYFRLIKFLFYLIFVYFIKYLYEAFYKYEEYDRRLKELDKEYIESRKTDGITSKKDATQSHEA